MEPINAAQEALEPSDSAQCIHHCFERIARMRPEACALISADGVLSYDELNRRANRLARRLQQCGVKQGDLVGVCLPRDSQLPAALLAVMKAGGAYVPLDADHPAERLRLILENTALTHIISVAALQRHLPLDVAHRLVLADAYCNDIAAEADDNLALPPIAESLVYCLFTSGSTGRPKGVAADSGRYLDNGLAHLRRNRLAPLRRRRIQGGQTGRDLARRGWRRIA